MNLVKKLQLKTFIYSINIKKLKQNYMQTNTRIDYNGGYLFCRDINPADYCDI